MFAEIGGKRDRSGLAAAIEEAQAMPQDQREKMTPEGQDEVDALRYLGSIYDHMRGAHTIGKDLSALHIILTDVWHGSSAAKGASTWLPMLARMRASAKPPTLTTAVCVEPDSTASSKTSSAGKIAGFVPRPTVWQF